MIHQNVRGTVYGVILNDGLSLERIGPLDGAPYKGAPQAPVLYIKPGNTLTACDSVVRLPAGAKTVEVAATVGLVMGRDAARLSLDHAQEAVSGLVLAADLSLPHDSYYRPAIREKCFDGSLPIGDVRPWVDPRNLTLTTTIDDQMVESFPLTRLVRDPARLLADVTEFMTLRRGDVLLVGVRYGAPQAKGGSQVKIAADGFACLKFSIAQGDQA